MTSKTKKPPRFLVWLKRHYWSLGEWLSYTPYVKKIWEKISTWADDKVEEWHKRNK